MRDRIQSYLFQDAGDAGGEQTVAPFPGFFADRGRAPLTDVEARRQTRTDSALATRPLFADAGGALREMGLWNGRVAYDHEVFREVSERHERPGTLSPADNALRWIRIVKSPLELALMRRGAQANAEAVDAAVAQVRAGANYREIRRAYATGSAHHAVRGFG